MKKLFTVAVLLAGIMAVSAAQEFKTSFFLDNHVYSYRINPAAPFENDSFSFFAVGVGNTSFSMPSNLPLSSLIFKTPEGKYTWGFGESIPAIASATDIQVMSRQAQDQGFAVDEVDVDGWKDEKTRDPAARRVAFHDFFDSVLKYTTDPQPIDDVDEEQNDDNGYSRFDVEKPNAPQYCWKEADECPPTDDGKDDDLPPERFVNKEDDLSEICKDVGAVDNEDDLSEIRKDVDARDTVTKKNDEPSKDENVDISTASDGNNYTYSITWTDKDGKPQTKTFYGEAAKKMMSKPNKEEKTDEKRVDSGSKLGDIIDRIEKRLSRLEDNIDRPVRIRRPKPFDRINELFYDNDLFGGMRDLFGGF